MADRKISELTNITGANLADDDEFALVDTSADETKAITFGEFKTALDTATGFVRITGDTMTGNLTVPNVVVSGNVDGRDVSADGTKLDTVETNADVTDTTNVTAAGALMDSELTSIASVKALNQGVATTDDPTFTNTQLAALAATISDTAVDIFVYDTRKDSDGGAWRKRTQHTSWYNETLNTATRGSRKEFPSVAVIVAESNQVTIYDGDDPDLPMWMVFNLGINKAIGFGTGGTNTTTSCHMLNGSMFVGVEDTTNSNPYSGYINFITEQNRQYGAATYEIFRGIVDRNSSTLPYQTLASSYDIVNPTVNDVAMTVLPNAPIDAATGLPVPTIAVATDGGVSVIKDDGTVVDITGANSYNKSTSVNFTPDKKLVYSLDYSGNSLPYSRYIRVDNIPSADFSATSAAGQVGNSLEFYSVNPVEGQLNWLGTDNSNENLLIANNVGTENGLTFLERNQSAPANGMVAYTASDYNTGYQVGDIKLATLSDTDDTDVTGSELVTNGTFDSNTSGWTGLSGGSLSVDTGRLKITETTGAVDAYAVNNSAIPTVIGKKYVISWEYEKGTNTGFAVRFGNSGQQSFQYKANTNNEYTADGYYSFTFTATGTELWLSFIVNQASTYGFVDNISVRLAEEDRSVNGNGLQVFGTVTKNPVATGADLVAYSGFNNNDYLLQPVNTDLQFGTGDFCAMGWFKTTNAVTEPFYFYGQYTSGWVGGGQHRVRLTSGRMDFGMTDDNWSSSDQTLSSATYSDGNWHHYCGVRRGGQIELYADGVLVDTTVITAATGSISNTGAKLYYGRRPDGASSAITQGSLALSRISATAPSPEQIAKIYEDEKVLFQENAQATLYGSSDAVTALAYDDSTELLHVGTSEGRSVFQGLRRVDNTTTAVGAAISASNGLVADE